MDTEPTVNIPLLRKAVEWAEAEAAKPNPLDRQWVQKEWRVAPDLVPLIVGVVNTCTESAAVADYHGCGTAYCIAGYIGQSIDPRYAASNVVDGVHVADFAEQQLGIAHDERQPGLFHSANTVEDIRRIAEDIAGEPL